jgi:hypothetical protein
MPEPWDRPPIPKKGDPHEDSTYSAVGRVLAQWERVEVELAHLYACFKGQPTNSLSQIREYGIGTIFRERALADAADSYFRANCCQHHEGDFDALLRRCLGFSCAQERRGAWGCGFPEPTLGTGRRRGAHERLCDRLGAVPAALRS